MNGSMIVFINNTCKLKFLLFINNTCKLKFLLKGLECYKILK